MKEFQQWMKYRNKCGSFNPMMRTEWAAALICSTLANVNRGKDTPSFSIHDFAPHINPVPVSLEDAMQQWS